MNVRRALTLAIAASCLEVIFPLRDSKAAPTVPEGQTTLELGRFKTLLELAPIHVGAPNDLVHLIVFFDPNCPWCAKLWNRIYGNANALASAWIPVPYMKTTSAGRAAAILRAPVPATALAANFASYDAASKTGGIEPVSDVTAAERSRFGHYITAWKGLAPATPVMVYVSRDGNTYCQVGLPPQDTFEALLRNLPGGRLTAFP